MIRREGAPACEPVGESWWCRLKERMDYLWDRASACILTINHKTPDGDGDFAISAGDGIAVTDEDNGIRISATINEETVEGIVGQEAAARQQADAALQQDIDAEEAARQQADAALQQAIGSKADSSALTAESNARQQADAALQQAIGSKADASALTAEINARQQADTNLRNGKLDRDQGSANAGKTLIVGGDGIVKPGTSTASVAWGGISGDLADQTDLSDALAGKADDADVVHKSGTETVGGAKTFSSNLKVTKSNPQLLLNSSEVSIDNPPTSWTRLAAIYNTDSSGKILHSISGGVNNGTVNLDIGLATLRAGQLVSDGLRLFATPDRIYASCPDVPTTSTGQEIVNARTLNQWPSLVRTIGNQSIAGVKSFTQTPQAPTPSPSAAGTEIVTAAWVRAHEGPRTFTGARLQQILASGGALIGHITVESASADYSGMISAVLDSLGSSYTGGILSDGSSVLICLSIKITTASTSVGLMALNGSRQSGDIVSLYGWAYDTNGKVVDP